MGGNRQNPETGIPRERIERAARMYKTSRQAGQALGIAGVSFNRLCRKFGILTPAERSAAQ